MLKYTTKQASLLGGALMVQAALFGFLLLRAKPQGAFQGTEQLVTVNLADMTKVVIEDNAKKSLEMTKEGDSWRLPTKHNAVVSQDKWKDTVALLSDAKKSWPVGTTENAAKQFHVSQDGFERKLTFYKGDKPTQTIFFGNSPSFKKVYVRTNSEDVTYTVDLSLFDLSTDSKDWLDKSAYKIDRSLVKSVVFDQLTLEEKDGNLVVQDLKDKEEPNPVKVNALADTALNPPYIDIVGEGSVLPEDKLILKYTVHTKDNQVREFKFFEKPEAPKSLAQNKSAPVHTKKMDAPSLDVKVEASKPSLIMTVSGETLLYEVSRDQVSTLLEASRNNLVKSNG